MGSRVAFSLLVIVACATVIEAYPFQYGQSFSGGARNTNYGYRRRPVAQQYVQQQAPQESNYNNNGFFNDNARAGDSNYRPHGNLNFGGATGGNGVGISVGGGERPQVSVGMGAVGGGVGADVEGEGKYYKVKMMS